MPKERIYKRCITRNLCPVEEPTLETLPRRVEKMSEDEDEDESLFSMRKIRDIDKDEETYVRLTMMKLINPHSQSSEMSTEELYGVWRGTPPSATNEKLLQSVSWCHQMVK